MTSRTLPAKDARTLTFLCTAVYFCSYVTRINFSAVLVSIVSSEGYTKLAASSAVTGLFITYGIGQLISGYLGDKTRPNVLITAGLLTSAAMNLLIPFCRSSAAMTAVWCVNGFAQAMMWPPLVKIMSGLMTGSDYRKAAVWVSWGSSFGTIFVYLFSPLCISVSGWHLVFFISAGMAAAMAAVWSLKYGAVESRAVETLPQSVRTEERVSGGAGIGGGVRLLLGVIMLSIVLQGMLRDGITTWMPTYVSEVFDMKSTTSILTGVALPLFGIVSMSAASMLDARVFRNELLSSAVMFCAGFVSLLALRFLGGGSPIGAVLALTVAVGCMHGVNLILICMVPAYFKSLGKISLISGVLNSCTYVGSALSTYGIAVITERSGWSATVLVWCAVALAGTVCCAACVKKWKRFTRPWMA